MKDLALYPNTESCPGDYCAECSELAYEFNDQDVCVTKIPSMDSDYDTAMTCDEDYVAVGFAVSQSTSTGQITFSKLRCCSLTRRSASNCQVLHTTNNPTTCQDLGYNSFLTAVADNDDEGFNDVDWVVCCDLGTGASVDECIDIDISAEGRYECPEYFGIVSIHDPSNGFQSLEKATCCRIIPGDTPIEVKGTSASQHVSYLWILGCVFAFCLCILMCSQIPELLMCCGGKSDKSHFEAGNPTPWLFDSSKAAASI